MVDNGRVKEHDPEKEGEIEQPSFEFPDAKKGGHKCKGWREHALLTTDNIENNSEKLWSRKVI